MADNQLEQQLLDLQLLEKHLTKMYEKEGLNYKESLKIAQKTIDNESNIFEFKGLAWLVGKQDLEYFCLYFLSNIYCGEGKSPLSETHFQIWQEIQDMILKKDYTQRNYVCPRGFGKTTCISTPLAIWCHCYQYKKYTVIASAVGDTADEFLKNIKNAIIDNKKIESAFGKLIDSKKYICNSEKIEFTNRTMIQSISASGAIRGKNYNTSRIELLILDDYQKSDETNTEEATEKKWKIFNEDAKNAMQKNNSTILGVGTIQRDTCFYSRLIKSATWKSRIEKALPLDNNAINEYFHSDLWEQFYKLLANTKDDNRLDTAKEFYFQHINEMKFPMLWCEYWDCLDFALLYYEDKQGFFQEYQNDLSSIGEKRFQTIITKSKEYIEAQKFSKICLSIDPSGTARKGKKKDYYAFALAGLSNNITYIRKGEIKDFEYDDYIKHTLFFIA
ncbi:hypothetical protein [Clostridium tagluense]|uniref:Terminase n=1 Tax=Clostridium tagluense TaxID=360422 RepID=A0A401ULP6_9CLOT|nr:hypothetical protein [Clostridium tagluense]GCD10456.1 hypothetical protein Ctaglu_20790 [Clostridium tagluense]